MNLSQFSRLMQRRAKNLPAAVNEVKIQVATTGMQSLVWSTPVDTGQAVSNWRVGVGSSVAGTRAAYVPGIDRSTEDANRMAAWEAARNPLLSAKPGQTIHLGNNLDYIVDLDNGKSMQTPAGMRPAAIQSMRLKVASAKLNLER